jgi:hypothetical protein
MELLARFGPTEYDDYDEALSRVKQKGTLRENQQEFEKLANRVVGWPQKALIRTFLGGLKANISNDVRKFKPRTLRETIEFARMREDELTHIERSPSWESNTTIAISSKAPGSQTSVKKLSWEEMQKRRVQGLCFNCTERFTPGHRCAVPHVFIIEADLDDELELEHVEEANGDERTRP